MSSLLDSLNLVNDLTNVSADQVDDFGRRTNNCVLVLNKRVKVPGSINGQSFPTWATLRNADWHRFTVRDHTVRKVNAEPYASQVVGMAFRNVKIDIELEIGGQLIALPDLMYSQIAQLVGRDADVSNEKYDEMVRQKMWDLGLRFDGGMTIFTQQMGASVNGYAHAVEHFKSAGALDELQDPKSNVSKVDGIHTAYDFGNTSTGLKVLSFEMIPVDRKQSKNGREYNHGFIDLVDSVFENFKRMWKHNTEILRWRTEQQATGITQERTKELNDLINAEQKMANSFFNSMSGATRQYDAQTGNALNKYNPQNIPCGRWSALINGNEVDFNVWKDSDKIPTNPIPQAVAPVIDTSQKPF